ncbi:glycosyltransferase [Candidatus Parcubacteria bacterium]|nr:MAG: glycosyltransferase [Candidatus Parcubacteria bacterium]
MAKKTILRRFGDFMCSLYGISNFVFKKMRLLILTQTIHKDDNLLGFFHSWLERFSTKFSSLVAICLFMGRVELPNNVKVLSLGKEHRSSKLSRILKFYKYIWEERKNYDAVFVHMNQIYVLLGGLLWKVLGKRIYLWRNHTEGNILTNIAVILSDKVFCTSPFSYTARFKKTQIMPAGVDTAVFKKDFKADKFKNSVLCFGRISPVKKIEVLIEAAKELKERAVLFEAHIIGDTLLRDKKYLKFLKEMVKIYKLSERVFFRDGVPYSKANALYNGYKIYVNFTASGSLDKTILEAMSCEMPVLVSNKSFEGVIDERCIFSEGDSHDLALKLERLFDLNKEEEELLGEKLRDYVIKNHSLDALIDRLTPILNG